MPSSVTWQAEYGLTEQEVSAVRPAHGLLEHEDRFSYAGWFLWLIPMCLSALGVLMIAFLTAPRESGGGLFQRLAFKQSAFLGTGLILAGILRLMPLSWIRRGSVLFWLGSVLLSFAARIPGIGVRAGGANRWVDLGFVTFQPLEILTWAVPLFLAHHLDKSKREGLKSFLWPSLILTLLSASPIIFQHHKGGTLLVLSLCMSMHVLSRGWKWPLIVAVPLGGGGLLLNTLLTPYSWRRWLAFFDPWSDPRNAGYQTIQGLIAFNNGGIGGVGLGKGLQKYFIPEAQTDYIFSMIGEELGLLGTLTVVALFAVLAFCCYSLYKRSPDPYISVLIWGLTASILFPVFLNLGGITNLMPFTGLPLPFLSAGGSAMIGMWLKVGVLTRVQREIFLRERDGRR